MTKTLLWRLIQALDIQGLNLLQYLFQHSCQRLRWGVSGNCAFLSLYLIQQSHHLGCRAPRFLSQSGPKLSWQGGKREEEIERCTLNSAPSPQDNSISDLSPFVHPSVVYQRTKALERKIREMGLWWNGQELRVYYGNRLLNAVWYSVSANL